ncbi:MULTISPECIES: beta-phosphoglucomutase family hydrolase [unclassified Vibrio]|uniref:beta-phosphoglucomutase family hydrolase n=1 Tax=unclassified Vibrio TaxID=2614977 RepID=UPI0010A66DD0|nr:MULTISPECIES: beta-phosphoglucomutase family hydrolase [unclassified Vibrio]WGY45186.1 beta-phosphoglucomutase family hydrolase [Vibrio sp. ABG19]
MNLERYKGLIFDMDGTLIDTMPAHIEAWRTTAEFFDFPFDGDWLHSMGGMPSYKIVGEINRKFGLALEPMEVAEHKMRAFAEIDDSGALIADTYAVFQDYLGSKKIAIGTGSQRISAEKLLSRVGVLDKLDAVVTATEVENHKPHPETFLRACELIGLQPSECVVFEDTHLGKQAAHAGGMDCIMVTEQGLQFHPLPQ